MEINKVPLYDEHGDPIALFAMVSAIDQRKELEQTFRQQQLLQRRLLDAIPDLIRLEDHQGVLIDCNQAFLDFMGLVASEALGRRVPPRLPVEQTLGQGSIAWWMPRAEAAIWRSPGSRCRMTRATPRHPYPEPRHHRVAHHPGPVAARAALRQPDRPAKLSHFLQTSRHLGPARPACCWWICNIFARSTIASAYGSPTAC